MPLAIKDAVRAVVVARIDQKKQAEAGGRAGMRRETYDIGIANFDIHIARYELTRVQ